MGDGPAPGHGVTPEAVAAAAERIVAARLARQPLAALPEAIRPMDQDEAYEVLEAVQARLAPRLGGTAGYKIGCTTPVMQAYLGVGGACAGRIYGAGVHASGVVLRHDSFLRVGVECEIAVRIGADIGPAGAPFTATTVAPAVAEWMPAMEIVDDRYADWRTLGPPTLIADDFFAAGCILGAPRRAADMPDAAGLAGVAEVNGVETGRGVGADAMGHPLNALAWLANHLAARGSGLRRGEIVLTGSLVQTCWLEPGDRARVSVDALGSVEARVARA